MKGGVVLARVQREGDVGSDGSERQLVAHADAGAGFKVAFADIVYRLAAVDEDGAYSVRASDLLAGFTDANADTLSLGTVTSDHATVTANADGTYDIALESNYHGLVTLTYSVADSQGGTTAASNSFTVNSVNDLPTLTAAKAVLADGTEDETYVVTASDLLSGYTDADGTSLAIVNLSASNGTLVDNGNGTYSITPTANFNGAVTLSYEISDGIANVAASQSYTIASVNDAPQNISIDRTSIAENSAPGTIVGTISADDADSDELIYSLLSNANGRFTINPVTGAIKVANNAVLDFEVTPSLTITVKVADLYGDFTTKDITIALTDVIEASAYSGTKKADTFTATNNDNWTVMGQAGNDILTTLGGADQVTGGKGDDKISTGSGNDLIVYGLGDGTDAIAAGAGIDTLQVLAGTKKVFLSAIAGVEVISGSNFAITGTANADTFDFSAVTSIGSNIGIEGLGGNDTIIGTALDDLVDGGKGNDSLSGGAGSDKLFGQAGDDVLLGGSGNDVLDGAAGNDRLSGGIGSDTLTGGAGKDVFVFTSLDDSNDVSGVDHIVDFSLKKGDRIDLSAIDANSTLAGDQVFRFIGTTQFFGAGQLRYENVSGHTEIYGDVNGDGIADLRIVVDTAQGKMYPIEFVL